RSCIGGRRVPSGRMAPAGPPGGLGPLRGGGGRAAGWGLPLLCRPRRDRGGVPARRGHRAHGRDGGGAMSREREREWTPLERELRRLHLTAVARRYPALSARAAAEGWSHAEYLERLVV